MALFLYIPVGVVAIRRFTPRLPTFSRRLALSLLLTQILVIAVSLVFRTTSDLWRWLWSLNREGNIPALLATAQYTLAALAALLAAWRCPRQMGWQRFYLAAFGLLFALLAVDESLSLHEKNRDLEIIYVLLGPVLLALSAVAAARSPRQNRIWHICLFAGLALAGFGELVVEQFRRVHICGRVGFIELSRCLEPYYVEEPLAFLGIWLALVAVLGHLASVAPSLPSHNRLSLLVLPGLFIWLVFRILPLHQPVLPAWAQPAAVAFESGTHITGYQIDQDAKTVSIITYFDVGTDISNLGYSLHVVDQISQESLISYNKVLRRGYRKVTILWDDFRPLYNQEIALDFPPNAPTNHAYWLVLTLWRETDDGFARQEILASDLALLDNTQVILGEIALRDPRASPIESPLAIFDHGLMLEAAEMPDRAAAGEALSLRFAWRSDSETRQDLAQFLHLGHADSGEWFVYDQQPLGPRLPTRLWYKGLADSETWQVPLPEELAPGRYQVFTGLYRARDKERIPVTDAAGQAWLDARVALGDLIIGR